jgi:hypothetical protein
MKRFDEDSLADKAFRFVLGALLGAAGAWTIALQLNVQAMGAFARLVAGCGIVIGGLAVVFGNAFLEGIIRRWR